MKKVLFLHGLESNQGGPKVDFLSSVSLVYAPEMVYRIKNWSVEDLVFLVEKCTPDLIIGSSMGGYLADVIGSYTGIDVLLFNPALHSRSFDYHLNYGKEEYKRIIVLGEEDDIIDPEKTKEMIENNSRIINLKGMGHRIDLNTFKVVCNEYIH